MRDQKTEAVRLIHHIRRAVIDENTEYSLDMLQKLMEHVLSSRISSVPGSQEA